MTKSFHRVSASTVKAGKAKHLFFSASLEGECPVRHEEIDSGLEKLFAFLIKGLDGPLTLPYCLRYEYDVGGTAPILRAICMRKRPREMKIS